MPRLDLRLQDAAGNAAAGVVVTVTPLIDDVDGDNVTAAGFAAVGDAVVGEDPILITLDANGEGGADFAALRYRLDVPGGGFIIGTLDDDTRAEDLPSEP